MKKWMISVMCVLGTTAVPAAPDTDESVQESLERAREMLDEAAGRFAEHVVEYVDKVDFEQWSNRPFLGIMIEVESDGVRVASVTPGSGAEDAGIRAEDLIVRVNDAGLTGSQAPITRLHEALDQVEKGETVEVELLRDGETMTVVVVPQVGIKARIMRMQPGGASNFPGMELAREIEIWPGWNERRHEQAFGFKLVDIGETLGEYFGVDGGVLVLSADDDSDLLPGDIVQRVDEDDVGDAEAAYLALADAEESVKVVVRREGKRKTLNIEPIEGVKVRKSIEFTNKTGE